MADTEHRFKYVFIPADESIPVEEREGIAVGSAGGDILVNLLRPHFLRGGSVVDADAARREAERHLGPEKAARLSPDRLVAATESGSTETFALVHPASTNGYRGVYLYTDECGKLKSLPENPRALELAQRCGIDVRHPFHGDAFVGAVKTSPPPMRNVSFTEHELDPGSPWMLIAPAENAVYAETFREFMSAVEGKATREELEHRRTSVTEETEGRRSRRTSEGEEIPPHGLRLRDGVETYHSSLASCVDAPVSVENSCAAGGVGVVTTRRITRGEAIWSEAPLVSIQSPSNVDEALCCGWCHRAVGDIDAYLSLTCGAIDGDAARGNGTDRASPPWIAVRSLGPSLAALAEAEGTPPIVRCKRWRNRGCKEVYCGDECARYHALAGHDVLCCSDAPLSSDGDVREEEASGGGGGDEAERAASSSASALREFFSGNDNLHMIARVVGAMASAVASGQTWDEATLRFRAFVGIPWWETYGSTGAEKRLAKRSMRLMTESAHAAELNVAREADAAAEAGDEDAFRLARDVRNVLHSFPDVLSRLGLDGVGHLLGVCDMNQLSMTIDGPMRNVCRKLLRVDEYEGADAAKQTLDVLLPIALRAQAVRDAEDAAAGKPRWGGEDRYEGDEEEEEEEEDRYEGEVRLDETADAEDLFDASRRLFGGFKGQALFSLLCLVNHSCEPSTAARFSSWKGRAMVRLEALRDIECGEELTMSYIDESETLEERTSALASYGFACRCNKCVGEGADRSNDNSDVD